MKQKNVLLALGWYDHRLLKGIAAYAAQHRWHLAAHSIIHEKVIPWGWQGDGVLAWLAAGDDLADFVVSVKRPTVDFSMRRPHLPFARVIQDHAKTGSLVAAHFLSRGFRHFLFYSDLENWSQEQRGEAFVGALEAGGHTPQWLRWHKARENKRGRDEWPRRRAWLLAHLRRLPKPIAVFAANGTLAVEVQELCEEAGIPVPDAVAIVGIEDYLLSVGGEHRSISGVDTNLEEQGYQGAALLDLLMRGERKTSRPLRIAPARVITRKSSDIFAVAHPGVAKGLRFIANRFAEPVGVGEIAEAAGMSLRGLHDAFVEHLGSTPGGALRSARLDFARKRLAETDDKIDSIARQSGYPHLNTFFITFRKAEDMTPTAYRKRFRRAQ